ncbi:MAG: PD40 domain-containing protein, partial [Planctomycetes bacterium]|nr:PD40 domain-containing protein [Planctomycetota bacterium]
MKHLGKNLVIVIALVAAGFFLAYLRFRPYLGQESGYTDGERRYAGDTFRDVRYAVWEDPEALGGEVNSPGFEGRPAVSPDGRWLVFPTGERGLNSDLWIAEIVDGEPREPQPLRAVNSDRDEWAPAFGADALYFASDRPGTLGGLDLFRASYQDGAFGPVEAVGPGINSAFDDTDPAPLPGSRALAFASDRPRGARRDFDLWLAPPDGGAEPLTALNTPFQEREPAFVGDARTLLFASDRAGGAGGFDLYRSVSDRGEWLPAEALPGLNGAASERGPSPSPDGFALLFAVEDGAGGSDLFRARSRELFPVPGRPIGWVDLAVFASLLLLALLAWLAKRWEAMDLLYKCVLAAVVLHILLLLWFRGLYPESGGVDLPERDALFRIKLAAVTAPSRAANRAFGGELDTDRSAVVVADPRRTRAEFEDAPAEAAPERQVQRVTAAAAAAPGRQLAEHLRSQLAEASDTVEQMRTPLEQMERRSEDAPRLTVRLSEDASGAERSAQAQRSPERAESASLAEAAAWPVSRPQERQAASLAPAPAFESAAASAEASERQRADPRSALAVAQPVERVERFAGEARELSLAEATATRRESGRSVAEPARRGGARVDLLAAAVGEPDMAARGPLARAEAELDAPLERERAAVAPRQGDMPLLVMR